MVSMPALMGRAVVTITIPAGGGIVQTPPTAANAPVDAPYPACAPGGSS